MGDVIAVASRSNILLFKQNDGLYYRLQIKVIVSHTNLQACQQLLSGQVWMTTHQRKWSLSVMVVLKYGRGGSTTNSDAMKTI